MRWIVYDITNAKDQISQKKLSIQQTNLNLSRRKIPIAKLNLMNQGMKSIQKYTKIIKTMIYYYSFYEGKRRPKTITNNS